MSIPLPYEESYWIIPDLFMAGEYPAGYDELQTRHRIQSLIRSGLTNFIDLTHPNDYMPKYSEILQDEANGYLKTVQYANYAIPDRSVTSVDQMKKILDEIDRNIEKQNPTYLHCIAGIGRTGTVVGCYLVRHGLSPEEAMKEIKRLRSAVPSHWARSPEADEQVDYILDWKPDQ
jgi:hypothetical protein